MPSSSQRVRLVGLVLLSAALLVWLLGARGGGVVPRAEDHAARPASEAPGLSGALPPDAIPEEAAAPKPSATTVVGDGTPPPTRPASEAGAAAESDLRSARLLDGEFRPVAALRLVLVRDALKHGSLTSDHAVFRSDGPDVRAPWAEGKDAADVSADGHFRWPADGALGDSDLVLPTDVAWMARRPSEMVGKPPTVVVDPAAWIVARVVDEHGNPVPRFDARVADLRTGEYTGFAASGGGFVVQFRRPSDRDPAIEAAVIAARDGRVAAQEMRIPADRSSAEVTLTLRRTGGTGRLVLSVSDASEALRARPFEVEVRLLGRPDLVAERRPAAWSDPRTVAVDVPEGGWTLRVRPADGSEHVPFWEERVTVAAGVESRFSWSAAAESQPVDARASR